MSDQKTSLLTAYGAVAFYMHVTEDVLKLHLADCDYYKINAYQLPPNPPLNKLRFQQLIDEFGKIHPDPPSFILGLHCIREARNDIIHEFITQVGSDVESVEGRDQIHALLLRLVAHQVKYLGWLRQIHEALLREIPAKHLERLLKRDEEPFTARVSTSGAEMWVDELDLLGNPNVAQAQL